MRPKSFDGKPQASARQQRSRLRLAASCVSWLKNKKNKMSMTVTIEEAQANLKDIIHQLAPGDEIIITENHKMIAKLVSETAQQRKPRVPGLGKGMITLLVEDDEHLDGFSEYMP